MIKNNKTKIIIASAGSGINLLLFFTKLYIGLSVNSVAIYADAINSLADSAVCIIAIIGFALISAQPSRNYPFGTGKSEDLLSLVISAVIVITGAAFAYTSLNRLMYPVPVWYSTVYAVLIAATAAVKLALFAFFAVYSKREKSNIIKGMSADSLLDFFITLCTLISFLLTDKIAFSLDGVAGMVISIILLVQGIKMTASVCARLTGKRDDALCRKAKKIIEDTKGIECLSVECHSYGQRHIFTACIRADSDNFSDITALSQTLEDKLNKKIPCEIYIKYGGKYER